MKNLFTLLSLLFLTSFGLKAQCNAEFSESLVTCDSLEFYPVYYGPGVTYYWDFGDGDTSTETIPAHGFDADGSYFVILTVSDSIEGCSDVYTGIIEIDCATSCSVYGAMASFADSSGCGFSFVGTATGGTFPYSYYWDFGDGTTALGSSQYHEFLAGTWTVSMTVTDAAGCDTTIFEVVSASCSTGTCDASFLVDTIACDSFQFLPYSTSATDYYWNFGDGYTSSDITPVHSYDADGTYGVVLTIIDSISGCSDTYTYSLEVICDYPCTVDGAFDHFVDSTNCSVNFVATAFGGVGPYSFSWNYGDGSTGAGCCPTHYYDAGVYEPMLTITDATGCDTTIAYSILVDCDTTDGCNAGFDAFEVDCDSFYFEPVVPYGVDHYWDFGDGFTSTESFPFHTYAIDGIYVITHSVYDSTSGCADTYYLTVSVECDYPCTVDGAFDAYVDSTTCDVYFTATAFGGTGPYAYDWSFGDGTSGTGCCPTHYYPSGTWTPTLTITDLGTGCDTTIYDVVYVYCDSATTCNAYFTVDDYYCDSIWFMPEMTSGVSHTWDFGDGYSSTDVFANHTYLADGSYTVVHTVYDSLTGCFDAYTFVLEVDCDAPCALVGTATYYLDSTDCSVHFSSAATGGSGPYTFDWSFGDGTYGTGCCPTHYYPSASFTPVLTITDAAGCEYTTYLIVDAYCDTASAPCNAYFDAVEISCDSIWFSPYSTGPAVTHYWDFGDGFTSSEVSPTHVYSMDGTYTVVHTIIDSAGDCSVAYTELIVIDCDYPCTVDGDFIWYADSSDCGVTFTATAFGGTAPYTYYWEFGDGYSSTSCCPTHYYPSGTWTPTLTITDAMGCDTTIYDVVNVDCDSTTSCVATFTTSYLDCNTIQFYGMASPSSVFYSWDFGDGTSASGPNPTHTFADGTYMVYLTTYDSLTGCTATYWDYFVIDCDSSTCSAIFTYTSDSCGLVSFMPVPADPSLDYYWDFGDGTTSTLMDPTHYFSDDTIYYVVLTVTDSSTGCYDVYTAIVTIDCGSLGTEELTDFEIVLYPNPTAGIVTIKTDEAVDYIVTDMNGRLIFESNTGIDNQIDLTDMASGVYLVQILHRNLVINKKIQKQ